MPASTTRKSIADPPSISNLFLPVPDTDLRAFLAEVAEVARFAPEIITAIENDLNAHAREKKRLRLADQKFYESQTEDLPGLEIEDGEEIVANADELEIKIELKEITPKVTRITVVAGKNILHRDKATAQEIVYQTNKVADRLVS